ncbi:MAG: hypothetical protein JWQ21_2197 [Herminiimonas sp.]|nr:hypothetical protein [Herminiimonas sp.]
MGQNRIQCSAYNDEFQLKMNFYRVAPFLQQPNQS